MSIPASYIGARSMEGKSTLDIRRRESISSDTAVQPPIAEVFDN